MNIYKCIFIGCIVIVAIYIIIKLCQSDDREVTEKYSDIDKYADSTIVAFPESITEYQKDVPHNWIYKLFDECYVIYLDKRKNNMENLMRYLNIEPNLFSAIHKDIINRDLMIEHKLLDQNSKLNMGRIACHLSHLYVLQQFLKNDKLKTCIIFEDDIAIPKNLTKLHQRFNHIMSNVPKDWDVINFGGCWDICNTRKKITHELYRSYRAQCRHCYAVSKNGARVILMNTLPMSVRPGDYSITALAEKGILKMYSTSPSLFFQNREEFGTNLGNTALIQKECLGDHTNKLINLEKRLKMISNNNVENNYKIYYINSSKSIDKDNYMKQQFSDIGLKHVKRIEEYKDNIDGLNNTITHRRLLREFVSNDDDYALVLSDNVCIYLLYINKFSIEEIVSNAPLDADIILLYNNKQFDDTYTKLQEYSDQILGYIVMNTSNIKQILDVNNRELFENSNINIYSHSPNLLFKSNYFKEFTLLDDNSPEEQESVSIINNILE